LPSCHPNAYGKKDARKSDAAFIAFHSAVVSFEEVLQLQQRQQRQQQKYRSRT
jgi:hypothetical protein